MWPKLVEVAWWSIFMKVFAWVLSIRLPIRSSADDSSIIAQSNVPVTFGVIVMERIDGRNRRYSGIGSLENSLAFLPSLCNSDPRASAEPIVSPSGLRWPATKNVECFLMADAISERDFLSAGIFLFHVSLAF